jgi:hypothetical protein
MKFTMLIACAAMLAFATSADARGHSYGGGRVSYGGGHHTSSHGGHYAGASSGSSHRGGSYRNVRTGNRYGTHR